MGKLYFLIRVGPFTKSEYSDARSSVPYKMSIFPSLEYSQEKCAFQCAVLPNMLIPWEAKSKGLEVGEILRCHLIWEKFESHKATLFWKGGSICFLFFSYLLSFFSKKSYFIVSWF